MYLARHDPNLRELNLCELNRPMRTRTKVIPASQDLVELVMPDTLTEVVDKSSLMHRTTRVGKKISFI